VTQAHELGFHTAELTSDGLQMPEPTLVPLVLSKHRALRSLNVELWPMSRFEQSMLCALNDKRQKGSAHPLKYGDIIVLPSVLQMSGITPGTPAQTVAERYADLRRLQARVNLQVYPSPDMEQPMEQKEIYHQQLLDSRPQMLAPTRIIPVCSHTSRPAKGEVCSQCLWSVLNHLLDLEKDMREAHWDNPCAGIVKQHALDSTRSHSSHGFGGGFVVKAANGTRGNGVVVLAPPKDITAPDVFRLQLATSICRMMQRAAKGLSIADHSPVGVTPPLQTHLLLQPFQPELQAAEVRMYLLHGRPVHTIATSTFRATGTATVTNLDRVTDISSSTEVAILQQLQREDVFYKFAQDLLTVPDGSRAQDDFREQAKKMILTRVDMGVQLFQLEADWTRAQADHLLRTLEHYDSDGRTRNAVFDLRHPETGARCFVRIYLNEVSRTLLRAMIM
jgi:hypothetical protein